MDELVANLLAAYRSSISRLDWMTEETKQRAYEKLDTFRPKIGYPEKFRDYSGLRIRPDDLLGNVAAAASFETDRQLGKIGSPVDRDEWFMLPQTVNRSEEHTSELQSRQYLVCRLLLEKNK